jgi:hypothetical protein
MDCLARTHTQPKPNRPTCQQPLVSGSVRQCQLARPGRVTWSHGHMVTCSPGPPSVRECRTVPTLPGRPTGPPGEPAGALPGRGRCGDLALSARCAPADGLPGARTHTHQPANLPTCQPANRHWCQGVPGSANVPDLAESHGHMATWSHAHRLNRPPGSWHCLALTGINGPRLPANRPSGQKGSWHSLALAGILAPWPSALTGQPANGRPGLVSRMRPCRNIAHGQLAQIIHTGGWKQCSNALKCLRQRRFCSSGRSKQSMWSVGNEHLPKRSSRRRAIRAPGLGRCEFAWRWTRTSRFDVSVVP